MYISCRSVFSVAFGFFYVQRNVFCFSGTFEVCLDCVLRFLVLGTHHFSGLSTVSVFLRFLLTP